MIESNLGGFDLNRVKKRVPNGVVRVGHCNQITPELLEDADRLAARYKSLQAQERQNPTTPKFEPFYKKTADHLQEEQPTGDSFVQKIDHRLGTFGKSVTSHR